MWNISFICIKSVKEPNPWQLKTKIDFMLCFQQFSVELCDNRCNSSPANMLFHSQAVLTLTYNNSCMKPPKSSKELQRAKRTSTDQHQHSKRKKHCSLTVCFSRAHFTPVWTRYGSWNIKCTSYVLLDEFA